jgi:hypothetical protein
LFYRQNEPLSPAVSVAESPHNNIEYESDFELDKEETVSAFLCLIKVHSLDLFCLEEELEDSDPLKNK